jgi:U6 snRNA-associated Sm-like protein LSm8
MAAPASAQMLQDFVEQRITVLTNDGRQFMGSLRGFDQHLNLVLEACAERVYHSDSGVETVPLGLYVVRGDNVNVIGEVDEEVDSAIDLSSIRAAPLKPLAH